MRKIVNANARKEDINRIHSGWYALNGVDLEIREVLEIMYDNNITDVQDFIKDRDLYVHLYLKKLRKR